MDNFHSQEIYLETECTVEYDRIEVSLKRVAPGKPWPMVDTLSVKVVYLKNIFGVRKSAATVLSEVDRVIAKQFKEYIKNESTVNFVRSRCKARNYKVKIDDARKAIFNKSTKPHSNLR